MTSVTSPSVSWFNFSEAAIDQISRAEKTERYRITKSVVFRSAVPVLYRKTFTRALEWFAKKVIAYIDNMANQLVSSAIWFEGARDIFLRQIASKATPPDPELFKHIEEFEKINIQLLVQCKLNIKQLRAINPESRIAAAFQRLEEAAKRIRIALEEIKKIAKGAIDSSEELLVIRALNESIDAKLAGYFDDNEVVPEHIRLADAAIDRIRCQSVSH